MSKDKSLCRGCRDDYYNNRTQPGFDGSVDCWCLTTAERVTRYRIGWWTMPDTPGAFRKVQTYSCWNAPGKFGHYKTLPDFIKPDERQRIEAGEDRP